MHKQILLALNLFATLATLASCDFQPPVLDNFGSKDERLKAEKQQKFPPCKSCSMFTESFRKGFEKTLRGKHEGGDAHWEEKNLGKYKTSELRLIEIQEMLCRDVTRGEQQCHSIAEDHEAEIEEWWKMQDEFPDFYKWFCIDTLKVCCPINHYGKDCAPCKDCSKNGVCKGNGTRKGNGHCNCDRGYTGENCNECANGFYESFKDETKLLCSQCHTSCQNLCKGPGARNCEKCKEGWFQRDNDGCYDIDECLEKSPCNSATHFCVNNEGSYACLYCDKSCDGCSGDGPDMCEKCAEGYELRDGMCAAIPTSEDEEPIKSDDEKDEL